MPVNVTKGSTKKEKIIELIQQDIPTKEIAVQVGTTEKYVYKEKSIFKRNELVQIEKRESISGTKNELVKAGQGIIGVKTDPNIMPSSKLERALKDYYDPNSINGNGIKNMYKRFQKGEIPAEVIAATGFHPEIVQKQYLNYQEMNSRDPFELQESIISNIGDPTPELETLINKAKTGTLLSNGDLLVLIHYSVISKVDSALKMTISNTQRPLPDELVRLICDFCERPAPGLILNLSSQIGKQYEQIFTSYRCRSCIEKLDQERKWASYQIGT